MYHEFVSIIPKLRIHVWGGLGSQLYAWALAEIFVSKTRRRIELVLHSSGVTRRTSDLDFLRDKFSIKVIDDFSSKTAVNSRSGSRSILSILRKLSLQFKVVLTDAELGEEAQFYPWTREIRGHYTNIRIPESIIKEMIFRAQQEKLLKVDRNYKRQYLIHYRLGDLLSLHEKKPIPPERFAAFKFDHFPVFVASDSIEEALSRLGRILSIEINSLETQSPWAVLDAIINSAIFIGTPSKISFWGIAMRKTLNPDSECFISKEHLDHLRLLTLISTFSDIKTY